MKKLKGQQELASLLGFTNFLRDQIPVQLSSRTPATNRIQEELGQRHVGPRSRSSVQQVENSFIESASRHQPDMDKAFHVSTDASQHRVGAVLYQVVNREKKYVLFTSKALKKGQRNYSATKRELLKSSMH